MPRTDPVFPPPYPNFVIIGAQRSATRWLRTNLSQHPDIFIPSFEVNFFGDPERARELGWREYKRHFTEGWDGEPFVGESTPTYMLWTTTGTRPRAEAMRWLLAKDTKLIAILRNPIDRSQSALVEAIKRGQLPSGTTMPGLMLNNDLALAQELGIWTGSQYAMCLRPFVEKFGDNLLLVIHDDIVSDPASVYREVLSHIGADPSFVPNALHDVLFSNRRAMRTPPLTPKERYGLFKGLFSATHPEVEKLTGRDLSAWVPPRPEE